MIGEAPINDDAIWATRTGPPPSAAAAELEDGLALLLGQAVGLESVGEAGLGLHLGAFICQQTGGGKSNSINQLYHSRYKIN